MVRICLTLNDSAANIDDSLGHAKKRKIDNTRTKETHACTSRRADMSVSLPVSLCPPCGSCLSFCYLDIRLLPVSPCVL